MSRIKPTNIVKGFSKMIVNSEDDFSEDRRNVCNSCSFRKNLFCGVCGCVIAAKSKVKEEYCPKNKWKDNMIVKNVGISVNNLSTNVVDLTHIERTSTVDFSFKNNIKVKQPVTFKFELLNDRGNYDFSSSVMKDISISVGCGNCTKVLSSTPSILGDSESFTVEVQFTPPQTGRTKKSVTLKFNKNEKLIINFKANVI